jgi:hypothetical protein
MSVRKNIFSYPITPCFLRYCGNKWRNVLERMPNKMNVQLCSPVSSSLRYLEVVSLKGLLQLWWSILYEWEYFVHKCVLECGVRMEMQLYWVLSSTTWCNVNLFLTPYALLFNNSPEVILLPLSRLEQGLESDLFLLQWCDVLSLWGQL